ncbi:uncharacterized protein LOC117731745 [Cyclopterus lumpus]|uniref:uncharacterized protein LOC117731745 n=1 Tax=Cyclopterus lumpus TaxID=8103 RepID=UPI0014861CED|nr:uncharacterized protein LOC117731745 [Cyclopterus lumpus]
MRVLWMSYLLIGCITCFPMGKEHGADLHFMPWPLSSGTWFSGMGVSSDPGSSSPLPSLPNPSSNKATGLHAPQDGFFQVGPGSFSSKMAPGDSFGSGSTSFGEGHNNSPEVPAYQVAYAGYSVPDGSLDIAYDNWSSEPADGYDAVEKIPEPVFSDVSALEPVYSLSSRSSYQRGRAVFAQTRYAPGKPVRPHMPVPRLFSKTSKQSGPAKAPTIAAF